MFADAPPQTLPLAILGGTFDPVHWGHVRIASETAAALRLPEVRLMPSQVPVHRAAPGATGDQRLAMLKLAVAGAPGLSVDDRELTRDTPSYTALTLASLRAEFPQRPLLWLIGIDAFMHINHWYQWPRLFELAHFVVLNRPGFAVSQALSPALNEVWQGRLTQSAGALTQTKHGHIFLHTVTPQMISATAIRNTIAAGASDNSLVSLLPRPVLAYIRAHQLYRAA
ncbi:MAG: nicotinate-nucleotide adenylyltransferase [Rhizobacter sp.]|nr:nicotinate-nucleotide adenylyltransferase [Burkholderiales bacterium]